jgi:hypothetical protein
MDLNNAMLASHNRNRFLGQRKGNMKDVLWTVIGLVMDIFWTPLFLVSEMGNWGVTQKE